MKKKLTALFLALVMCMTMSAPAFAEVSSEMAAVQVEIASPPIADEATQQIIEQQKNAVVAYQELMEHIETLEGNNYIYPDTYAGAYIDDSNKLCVSLTNCSEETISQYREYFSTPEVVYFKDAEYSYNELSDIMYSVSDAIANVSCVYVDEYTNVVKVGVSSNVRSIDNTYSDMPVEWYYQEPIPAAASLVGGKGITVGGSGYTVGVCGTFDGEDAVLFCGHGVELNETLKVSGTSTPFATVTVQHFENESFFDYAIATINSNATVTMTNKVYNTSSNPSYESTPATTITSQMTTKTPVGTIICKYGNVSEFGTGEVTSRNCSWTDSKSGMTAHGMILCDALNDSYIAGGDSGGPVYVGHVFHGTISGGSPTSGTIVYSPISATPNFIVKTS